MGAYNRMYFSVQVDGPITGRGGGVGGGGGWGCSKRQFTVVSNVENLFQRLFSQHVFLTIYI